MKREINLLPWNEISITKEIEHHTLVEIATIIIGDGEDYYYIEDDIEKIFDVSSMPHYIKEDWINYNKKELTTAVIDKHLKEYTERYEWQWLSINRSDITPSTKKIEEALLLLKSIKRQQIIKKII